MNTKEDAILFLFRLARPGQDHEAQRDHLLRSFPNAGAGYQDEIITTAHSALTERIRHAEFLIFGERRTESSETLMRLIVDIIKYGLDEVLTYLGDYNPDLREELERRAALND